MITIAIALRIAAFVVFGCATFGVTSRVNLVALGLALWVASTFLVG